MKNLSYVMILTLFWGRLLTAQGLSSAPGILGSSAGLPPQLPTAQAATPTNFDEPRGSSSIQVQNESPYKSCSLPTNKPIFRTRRGQLCGIDRKLGRQAACGIERYEPCPAEPRLVQARSWSFEEWGPALRQWDPATCQANTPGIEVLAKTERMRWQGPQKPEKIGLLFTVKTYHRFAASRGQRLAYFPRGSCIDHRFYYLVTEIPMVNAQCTPIYNYCFNECSLPEFGIEGYEKAPNKECGLTRSSLSNLSSKEYFGLLDENLKKLVQGNLIREPHVLESALDLTDEENLRNRRIPFSIISTAKDLVISMGEITTNETMAGFVIAEFYSRAVSKYLGTLATSVLELKEIKAQNAGRSVTFLNAITRTRGTVEKTDISAETKSTILKKLDGLKLSDGSELVEIVDGLIGILEFRIAKNKEDRKKFLDLLELRSSIFRFARVSELVDGGAYDLAGQLLKEAAFFFRWELEKGDELGVSRRLAGNTGYLAKQALSNGKAIFEKIRSTSVISTETISDDSLSPEVLDLVQSFNLSLGPQSSSTTLKFLDIFHTTVIEPLSSFVEDLEEP